ncbi:peptidase S41 [Siminovitchia terrae]|uniref:C-terminal processing peptidase n=1 Tax=Siminovitchia terrae TaxID=1914933 RepID=A0A429XD41_SIMTE|nr:S41 family peptidase [Siminovitchia terrae]RST61262.1 PDZ domain-containing protein [Siminovitchia terrae]GIN89232.1 peptidase S41 [Siminovitchia terrae]GIN95298.1 peptidase S41 [Siminovitchia terrae]
MNKKWLALLTACSLFFGAGGVYAGIKWKESNVKENLLDEKQSSKNSSVVSANLEKIEQAYQLIQKSYVKKVDHEQLVHGAIQGMIGTLKDPYSVYMDASTAERFNDSLDSSFDGIGAQVTIEEGKLTIVAPIKNTPAEKAGLKPRDQILKIDGKSVEGLDLYEATTQIRGEKGTVVKLEILRKGASKPFEVEITREEVPVVTVFADMKKEGNKKIGYIEITSFAEGTAREFANELNKLEKEGAAGLIIDVRGNPGGMLSSVDDILQQLVTDKKPYVQIEEKSGKKNPYFSGMEERKTYPISVLIDEGSASASEILAGALLEIEGYDLIGKKTFGKGTVQQAIPLEDGSNIKLTMFKWLTPNGNWIHDKGIKPTIEVEQPGYFHAHSLTVEKKLTRDMNNEEVKIAQELLTGLGYGPGRADGYFDGQTERAVRAFQSIEKIPVTGVIDTRTAEKLEEAVIKEIQDEQNDLQLQVALKSMK